MLDRFSGPGDDYGAAGDFEEFYRALAKVRGVRHARWACWKQVGAAFPGYLKNVIICVHHRTDATGIVNAEITCDPHCDR